MAHNLEIKDGNASFVKVGEKAWHGLGTYVEKAMTSEEAIKLGNLDYRVSKKKIQVAGGKAIPGYFANVRNDNGDALGIVTNDYQIIQNTEAFSFFDSIVDKGEAIFHTAGVLGKGEKIFVTAKLPEDILVHGEKVENWLLLTSGHDGKSSIQVGFSSIAVVCENTLQAALRGLQNRVSITHLANAKQKLIEAARIMGIASKYVTELNPIFNKMASVKITDLQLRSYIEQVMKPAKETINKETLQKEFSKEFSNKVDSIVEFAHDHSTQNIDGRKNTVWGAYNAISGYYGYLKNYKTQEEKMKDLYFKSGAKKIESAFALACELI